MEEDTLMVIKNAIHEKAMEQYEYDLLKLATTLREIDFFYDDELGFDTESIFDPYEYNRKVDVSKLETTLSNLVGNSVYSDFRSRKVAVIESELVKSLLNQVTKEKKDD